MVVLEFSISFSRSYSFIPQRDHRGLKDNGVDRLGRAGQREHAGQDRRKGGRVGRPGPGQLSSYLRRATARHA